MTKFKIVWIMKIWIRKFEFDASIQITRLSGRTKTVTDLIIFFVGFKILQFIIF